MNEFQWEIKSSGFLQAENLDEAKKDFLKLINNEDKLSNLIADDKNKKISMSPYYRKKLMSMDYRIYGKFLDKNPNFSEISLYYNYELAMSCCTKQDLINLDTYIVRLISEPKDMDSKNLAVIGYAVLVKE
tara:strand:- start:146 stop:538 length:393 start_codon:yes stop_codon:yes gene_type:complete